MRAGPLIARALVALGAMGWGGTALLACTLSTASLQFGAYDPMSSTAVSVQTVVTLSCFPIPQIGPATLTLGVGNGVGASYALGRKMTSASHALVYNLYVDATHTQVWGDGTGGSHKQAQTIPPPFWTFNYTVYGAIPAGQTAVFAGTYADTVVVTVSY